ncbi:MAG: hypothetical protein AB1846_14830 [Chloroflexota bacterium]
MFLDLGKDASILSVSIIPQPDGVMYVLLVKQENAASATLRR